MIVLFYGMILRGGENPLHGIDFIMIHKTRTSKKGSAGDLACIH
jgi:hypothetical protein